MCDGHHHRRGSQRSKIGAQRVRSSVCDRQDAHAALCTHSHEQTSAWCSASFRTPQPNLLGGRDGCKLKRAYNASTWHFNHKFWWHLGFVPRVLNSVVRLQKFLTDCTSELPVTQRLGGKVFDTVGHEGLLLRRQAHKPIPTAIATLLHLHSHDFCNAARSLPHLEKHLARPVEAKHTRPLISAIRKAHAHCLRAAGPSQQGFTASSPEGVDDVHRFWLHLVLLQRVRLHARSHIHRWLASNRALKTIHEREAWTNLDNRTAFAARAH
mmetsp:Transcript_5587/g.19191  ORF Transcript_5587/g.19191 Transcript_5587/m.19191 type:complete len:268 (+) Transcript_5587:1221-2024(+)